MMIKDKTSFSKVDKTNQEFLDLKFILFPICQSSTFGQTHI